MKTSSEEERKLIAGRKLIRVVDEKYSRIISVNPELGGLALENVLYGTFIKNIYDPTIGRGVLKVSSNPRYYKDFTIEQLTERLAKVLEMQKSEVVEFLPRLLGMNSTWEDSNGEHKYCFEQHNLNKGEYVLKIERVSYGESEHRKPKPMRLGTRFSFFPTLRPF